MAIGTHLGRIKESLLSTNPVIYIHILLYFVQLVILPTITVLCTKTLLHLV